MTIRYLKVDEVKRLLEAASCNRDRAIIRLLVRTGMRIGEAAALQVGDFDPIQKTVRVERSVVHTSMVLNRKNGALKYKSVGPAWVPKYKKGKTLGILMEDGSVKQVLPEDLGATVKHLGEFVKIGTKAHGQSGRVVMMADTEAWELIAGEIRGRGPQEWAWRAGAQKGTLGGRLTWNGIVQMVKRTAKRANLPKELCHPHVLRHTFAVHFLKAGGDLRSLQRIGGWSNLNTVTVYTQFDTADLSAIQARVEAKVGY